MPLIALAYGALAVGLLMGFGGFVIWGIAAAMAAAALAAMLHDRSLVLLAAVTSIGVGVARAELASDERCRESALVRRALVAILGGDARPHAYVPATMEAGGCLVHVALDVESGQATEGTSAFVSGRVFRQGPRLLVRDAHVAGLGDPDRLDRLRLRVGNAIDSLFTVDAPLVRALVIADQRAITRDVRARYADAGIVHLLSVSGLHVAVIAAVVELLLIAARLPRPVAIGLALVLTIVYVLAIGLPPAAVRAGTMFGVTAGARLLQRPVSPWGMLAVGALIPVILDPHAVLQVGYQLSVLGMASLLASAMLVRRHLAPLLGRRWRAIGMAFAVSVVASIVSLPIIAWQFGRVSLVAPLANLAAGPLFGALQPMVFLALVLLPVPSLARLVAAASHAVILAADRVADVAAAVPFAALDVSPTLVETICLGALALSILVACASLRPWRALGAGLLSLGALLAAPLADRRGGEIELHVLDVGQGDALALRTPRGRWVLVDAGRTWQGGDAGRETVVPYVRARGGEVAALVLTHPHADHVGGAATVIRALTPRLVLDAGYVTASSPYRAALEAVGQRAMTWRRARPGDSVVVDGVVLEILAPDSAWAAHMTDPNAASTVLRVRWHGLRILLVGDAEREEEGWLLVHAADHLAADVLKVGHHGARASSGDRFLDAVHPRVALVSVGAGNGYGHPSPETLARFGRRGVYVVRTDQAGAVVVRSSGLRLLIDAEGGSWEPSGHSLAR